MINQARRKLAIYQVLKSLIPTCFQVGVFSFFMNLLMLTVPIFMLQVYDRVLASYSTETLFFLSIICIFALIILSTLDVIRSYMGIRVSHYIDEYLSPRALAMTGDEILKGASYHAQSLSDINTLKGFLSSSSLFTFLDLPWTPIYLFVIFSLHYSLGLLATAGALILFLLALFNERTTTNISQMGGLVSLQLKSRTESTLRNAEVIQAMGMMPSIIKKWMHQNSEVKQLQNKVSQRSALILAISKGIRMILQLLVLAIGAYFVLQNELNPGAMIAASILMGRALAPIEQGLTSWKQMLAANEAYARLKAYFAKEPPHQDALALPDIKGKISFESVYYVPPHAKKPTLNNINLTIEQGHCVAIIGPCSSGKSTLSRLMVGAWQANSGAVRIDGGCVYKWEREHFGQFVGYLPQDIELFEGTIKENIARMEAVDDTAVVAAAQLADVHDLILHLPQGYDTEIGAHAHVLSTGQRQRIALARALYKQPKVLVLDEPNSNLDHRGEQALIKALEVMKSQNTTIILVTHHPGVLRVVDDIIILREGNLEAMGSKNEVFEKMQQLNAPNQMPSNAPSPVKKDRL